MDTDGGVEAGQSSFVSFTSCNRQLADAVSELVVSLGMKARRDQRPAKLNGETHGTAHRVSFTPTMAVFRLSRKANQLRFDCGQQLRRHHRMIVDAEPIQPVLMRCIAVDSQHQMYLCGRQMVPTHNTRAGACWVQRRVEAGVMKLGCLIAPTAADIRDVMIEGPSGLLAVAPPWCRPVFEPSKRRISWPGGARAICLSGEEPERARGLNVDTLWADELACWQRAQSTWDLAMLALRAGANPQALITTTPRRIAVLRRILDETTTVRTTDTTYANKAHLPPQFLEQIVGLYENTRLGRQEIYAEFLETTEGVWFANFDPARHVAPEAEYHPGFPVRIAIDAGTSRHTAAVFFQLRPPLSSQGRGSTGSGGEGGSPAAGWPRVTVFGEYLARDVVSAQNAHAIKAMADKLPCRGQIDLVRLDPAATARSSLGPAAYGEYQRVFGSRILNRWPQHLVLDGLDTIELLLETGNLTIHSRCTKLKDAFRNYSKQRRGGQWIDFPAEGHPEEDLMDALRGGIRDAMPEGYTPQLNLPRLHASKILG
jgi:phage terminase large subunit-like protein